MTSAPIVKIPYPTRKRYVAHRSPRWMMRYPNTVNASASAAMMISGITRLPWIVVFWIISPPMTVLKMLNPKKCRTAATTGSSEP